MPKDLVAKAGKPATQTEEQARRAVSAFRSLQPTLTSYARILTGKSDVWVEMAARDNGSTDGHRIFFRPPLALGDNTPHERRYCDKRNKYGLQSCKACAIREEVMVTIMHEIAHIAFESFEATTDSDKKEAIAWAVKETKSEWAERVAYRIEHAPDYKTRDYINLVSLINEYLPFLLNALEDARVNREMFKARPGLIKMFYADEQRIFEDGYEVQNPDGSVRTALWSEAPLNSQVMIGCFAKASGYDYSNWFHEDVVSALGDEELSVLIRELDNARSARDVYILSFKVLARLRELGFCETKSDPDPTPPPRPEPEECDDEEERSSDSDSVPGESGESGEPDGQPGEPDADNDAASEESKAGDRESSDSESSDDSKEGDSSSPSGGKTEGEEVDDSDSKQSDADGGESGDRDSESEGSDGGVPEPEDVGSNSEETQSGEDVGPSGDPGSGSPGSGGAGLDNSPAGPDGESSELDDEGDSSHDNPGPEDGPGEAGLSSDDIDTGADDGYGGTEVPDTDKPRPPMGTPEDIKGVLEAFGNHDEKPKSLPEQAREQRETEAIDKAVIQGLYFTNPSTKIFGVKEHREGHDVIVSGYNYTAEGWSSYDADDLVISEQIIQPALIKTRRVFSDNQRGSLERNKKSGRVSTSALGKRAWNNDSRLFEKRILPGKKDYFVVIGMDISGSTIGLNLKLEKRAIMAQATLLDRVGIPFAIYAHTGNTHDPYSASYTLDLEIYHIKEPNEPWGREQKSRLRRIKSIAANLDGHALEYLRKVADARHETDKVIMYYSDGKMPAENHAEELDILRREIRTCKQRNYTLMGVGIRTDSPRQHGLDTVEVWEDSDLEKVIKHLAKRLNGRR